VNVWKGADIGMEIFDSLGPGLEGGMMGCVLAESPWPYFGNLNNLRIE